MMVLSEIGVDIAPILASAGILGIALGFGAQSLVKDFLSGIFMIFEDQYGVGDSIDLGEAVSGTVEAVTLRVTRLRDVNGTVWYVRNGEILRVGNQSQNWARTVARRPGRATTRTWSGSARCCRRWPTTCGTTRTSGRHPRGARGVGRPGARARRGHRAGQPQDRPARAVAGGPGDARAGQGPLRPRGHRVPLRPADVGRTRLGARSATNESRDRATTILRRDRRPGHDPRASSRGSTPASPPTRCCGRCTPRRTSGRPPSGSRSSSRSTGAARRRTPTTAVTRACGCGTRPSRSRRTPATTGCGTSAPASTGPS